MINLFNKNTAEKRSFQNRDEFFKFIRDTEHLKLFEGHPEFGSFSWNFRVFKRRSIFQLYHHLKEEDLTVPILQAYEQQLDLLEMCKGDLNKPLQIPVSSDVDVEHLRTIWCFEYCKAHGYEVKEDFYRADNANRSLLSEIKGGRYADF
jgi:hypothetical protein